MTRLNTCWGTEEKRKEKNMGFNGLQLRGEGRRKHYTEEESEDNQFKAAVNMINYIPGFLFILF